LEQQIEELLAKGLGEGGEQLAELGRLGARLVLQRAVDEEVAAFLGRARYQRTPMATGSRNGTRPKPIQTAEGEINIAMPQVRGTAEHFVSRVIPDTKAVIRTRPLAALISGGLRARVVGSGDRQPGQRGPSWVTSRRPPSVASAATCAIGTPRSAARVWRMSA
jgi:transposase-like protein